MIFRNDDVNPNTNLEALKSQYGLIWKLYPKSRIVSGVTLFAKNGSSEAIYDDIPFKDKDVKWFYDVNLFLSNLDVRSEIASHGLIHVDHSKLSRDAQEMSILSSCNYLHTTLFIPPFNRYNTDTIDICHENNIRLVVGDMWKSFEFQKFNPEHKFWYYHSWRYDIRKLHEALSMKESV